MEKINPLGQDISYSKIYTADILYPISRHGNMEQPEKKWRGKDIWNLYEISYIEKKYNKSLPINLTLVHRHLTLRMVVDAYTQNILESKSVKLYLQGFHNQQMDDINNFLVKVNQDILMQGNFHPKDLSLEIMDLSKYRQLPEPSGLPLEEKAVLAELISYPDEKILRSNESMQVEEVIWSHAFRSLCPVTGQPDWATAVIGYRGLKIDESSLLAYLTGFRNHASFHEACCEKIFTDINDRLHPLYLWVSLHFLRRGGIDINPVRFSKNLTSEDIPVYGKIFNRQ